MYFFFAIHIKNTKTISGGQNDVAAMAEIFRMLTETYMCAMHAKDVSNWFLLLD